MSEAYDCPKHAERVPAGPLALVNCRLQPQMQRYQEASNSSTETAAALLGMQKLSLGTPR